MPEIVFLHGLESGPGGRKARWLAARYDVAVPSLTTHDWRLACAQAATAVADARPALVIGSSFGAAILLHLLQGGAWRGPSLLLAQAGGKLGLPDALPAGVPVWLVHGDRDEIIPFEDSERLAASSASARLIRVPGGDHRLNDTLEDGQMTSWIADLLAGR